MIIRNPQKVKPVVFIAQTRFTTNQVTNRYSNKQWPVFLSESVTTQQAPADMKPCHSTRLQSSRQNDGQRGAALHWRWGG